MRKEFILRSKACKGFTLIRTRLRRNLVNVQAFTLIEILVVISIAGFLVTMGIASYVDFNRRQVLDQTAKTIANDLRLAQSKAGAGDKGTGVCPGSLAGWFFKVVNATSYSIYGNCGVDFSVKTVNLPANLSFVPSLVGKTILFKPLSYGATLGADPTLQTMTITIQNDKIAKTKLIDVTAGGTIIIK